MSTDGIDVLMEYVLEQLGISQAESGNNKGGPFSFDQVIRAISDRLT